MMGIAYLWGYWEAFDIGITTVISFMSPADIFKAALIPLFVSFTSIALSLQNIDLDTFRKDSYGSLITQKGGKFRALKWIIILTFIPTLLICTSYAYMFIKSDKQIYFSVLMAWIWSYGIYVIILLSTSILPKINYLQRAMILGSLIYLIVGSYTIGVNNGVKIANGNGNGNGKVSVLTDKPCSYFQNPTFIANYNERIFLYSHFNNAICITRAETIRLKSNKEIQSEISK